MLQGIIDFSFIYYKYFFQLKSGRLRSLSYEDKDVTLIYYPLKEIEKIRKELEVLDSNFRLSICFDRKTVRSEVETYKENRDKKLSDGDYDNISILEDMLKEAGYNIYYKDGYEADDIVTELVKKCKEKGDRVIIYTPDSDLMVNICEEVIINRYKSNSGYSLVGKGNFEGYCTKEFKCTIPYNSILLYKSTVGDSSDNISGIAGFGPKSFNRYVEYLNHKNIDWKALNNGDYVEQIILDSGGYLSEEQQKQALSSLDMVKPLKFETDDIKYPTEVSTSDKRIKSYSRFDMKSLME